MVRIFIGIVGGVISLPSLVFAIGLLFKPEIRKTHFAGEIWILSVVTSICGLAMLYAAWRAHG